VSFLISEVALPLVVVHRFITARRGVQLAVDRVRIDFDFFSILGDLESDGGLAGSARVAAFVGRIVVAERVGAAAFVGGTSRREPSGSDHHIRVQVLIFTDVTTTIVLFVSTFGNGFDGGRCPVFEL